MGLVLKDKLISICNIQQHIIKLYNIITITTMLLHTNIVSLLKYTKCCEVQMQFMFIVYIKFQLVNYDNNYNTSSMFYKRFK